jgi:hypothetical protein
MHRIGRDKPNINDLKNICNDFFGEYLQCAKPEYKHMPFPSGEINDNDIIVFVFGEIDIRTHYGKQIIKGRNKNHILNELVNNYINSILLNRIDYPNVKFGLQSITPPTDDKNYREAINKEYPTTGPIEDRIEATIEINKLLKEKCILNSLLFIDTATYYQNDDSDFPIKGIDCSCNLFELDTRIKDDNVHVYIDNPEGIESAFIKLNIPYNL